VVVLSIPHLQRASGSGQVVLRVGIVRLSQVVPSALVSVVGLGCSRRQLLCFNCCSMLVGL
jgi:hypothetical protein